MELNKFSVKNFFEFLKNKTIELDIFSVPLRFQLSDSSKIKSIYGGTVSILILILSFIFILFFILDETLTSSRLKSYKTINSEYSIRTFNDVSSELNFSNSSVKTGFFYWTITIFNNSNSQSLTEHQINKFFNLTTFHYRKKLKSEKSVLNTYSHVMCENLIQNSSFKYNYNSLNNSLCLNSSNLEIKCDISCEESSYYSVIISMCKNSSFNKNSCSSTDEVQTEIRNLGFLLHYPKYNFNLTKAFNDLYIDYDQKIYVSKASNNFINVVDFTLSADEIYNDGSLFQAGNRFWTGIRVRKQKIKYNNPNGRDFLVFNFRADPIFTRNFRSSTQFLTVISKITGIIILFTIVGFLLVNNHNVKLLFINLSNDLFNVVDSRNEKLMNEMKFEKIMEKKDKEKSSFKNNLIKLNNKSVIECEICLKYYSSERVKEFKYDFKYRLEEIFNCRKKEKFVKNSKILKFAENETHLKLDILNLLNFKYLFSVFANITFEGKSPLLSYIPKSNVVSCIKIDYFKQVFKEELVKQKMNKVQKSLIKEVCFLEGLRSIRYKPLMDEKIDVNLIRMFNIENRILEIYFLNHSYLFRKRIKSKKSNQPRPSNLKPNSQNSRKNIQMHLVRKEDSKEKSKSFDERDGILSNLKILNI